MKARPSVAFFDLDRTLIDVNSASLWVKHEWDRGAISVGVGVRASYWLVRYALGDDTLDGAMAEASRVYTGAELAGLVERIERWFAEQVEHRLRPGAAQVLQRHREAGDQLVLATSSSQYAAECAVRAFGLDEGIGTQPEVVDGVLTGELAASAYGRAKLERCANWARERGVELSNCAFYTDSYSDLTLLNAVGRPVAVHPDRRLRAEARRRGWPIEDWGDSKA